MTNEEKLRETFPYTIFTFRWNSDSQTHGIFLSDGWLQANYDQMYKDSEPCEDAVNREAVDELSKALVHTTRDKADFLCNFWEGLQKLPPVTPKQRWIPVSERLPEPDRKDETGNDIAFLVQTEWGTFFTATYDGNWCHVDSSILVDSEVIAWMPLPEPYKEGESE